jgi:hypothetical protein
MDQDDGQAMMFSFESVMGAINTPPHARISKHEYAAFCDFAAGGDENVIAIRSGNKLIELESWRDRDTMAAVGRFIIMFRRFNLRKEQVWADGGGVGHAMCDALNEAGWPVNRFDFGAPAHNSDLYVSRGVEIWHKLAMRVEKREIVLINDPTLISQLTTRKMLYDSRGRIKMQPKDEMREEGLKSPDRADAVCGAFAHGAQTFATYVRRTASEDPFAELEKFYDGLNKDDLDNDRTLESVQRDLGAWAGE